MGLAYVAIGCVVVAGCSSVGEDSPSVYIPTLDYPHRLTITEGGVTSFALSTNDFSHGAPGVVFSAVQNDLSATPYKVVLSRAAPAAAITVVAAVDPDSKNETSQMVLYIPGAITGESPSMWFDVIDINAANVVASDWNPAVPLTGTTTVGVHLTRLPSAVVTVTLRSMDSGVVSVSPTTMTFGTTDFDVPQMFTATGVGTGTTTIALESTLPTTSVVVSVQ